MKINYDLLKEILLYVEETSNGGDYIKSSDIIESMLAMDNPPAREEVCYILRTLSRDGFLEVYPLYRVINNSIVDITTKGRELLYLLLNKDYIEKIIDKATKNDKPFLWEITQQLGIGTACNIFPKLLPTLTSF